ncbi:flagellar hook assembly protein FlgD [Methylomonas sp. MED-D]|uniref:Basal-body rod modification protein FlgD n=1 Tax=Methylomonas koyamae TaxID=702114 RepID=A0A177PFW3_9GAMM|nr:MULTISPECIES: flagellar hook assembly protein FlgD [Methylomonas]NJA08375.1 flagellar hook assembly protein FlgD [Methylococcaceae bacterium WWC4]MDT4330236.1 flagellar hook assembly protein FlgD [Methylomonas sp. MV1]OAI29156.1 flagellar hook capping protein [Methylomonas koyamae]OHX38271.1 flagellar hook capping protein [Methylomonas sp. LWB]WGS86622.1 flagellar hook assembly protein FlgD [Methylomonas sp. UP202]
MTTLTDTFNSLGLATTGSASSASSATSKSQSLSQSEFLKLLTTQLTHQDPTKPMDNAEFVSQMAQISAVSGIQELQTSFQTLSDSLNADQALQAASIVGHTVVAPGSQALLSAGGSVSGELDIPSTATSVGVQIVDPETGTVVRELDLGAQSAGTLKFEWDGNDSAGTPADPGVYKIKAFGWLDGTNTALDTSINSKVKSVAIGSNGSGLSVNLEGLGDIKFSKIKQIL